MGHFVGHVIYLRLPDGPPTGVPLSPEVRYNARFVVQGAQFLGICWCIDRFVFHLSMVKSLPRSWIRLGGFRATRDPPRKVTHSLLTPRHVCRQTHGPSMMPTLNEMGDVVIVDKISVRWNPVARNDIVIADSLNKYVVGGPSLWCVC